MSYFTDLIPTPRRRGSTAAQGARSRLAAAALCLGLGLAMAAGCGEERSTSVSERLWVSGVPVGPRAPVHAFVITEVRGRKLGTFYQGSAFQGQHDVFLWTQRGPRQARIRFLQDGQRHEVRVERCEPSRGFDRCIRLEGDPTGGVRYQSRKRWVVPRRGKRAVDPVALMQELAEDDASLASALGVPAEE